MSDLRFYTFVNFYLSSIQQGVQSFHVLGEMFNKYGADDLPSIDHYLRLNDWSRNHKTLIVLNGGANADIEDTYYKLEELSRSLSFPLPFAKFNEDSKSLGGIITACGCVLPQEIYEAVDFRKASDLLDARAFMPQSTYEARECFFFINDNVITARYLPGTAEHELIALLKSCSLAR